MKKPGGIRCGEQFYGVCKFYKVLVGCGKMHRSGANGEEIRGQFTS